MNRIYGGVRAGLEPADIAGIQAIYGPRRPDFLQSIGQATSAATAPDVSWLLRANAPGQEQTTIGGLSLDAIGDTEYFSVVAPAGGSAETMQAAADPQDLSSLSPRVTILDATTMRPLATAGNAQYWGDCTIANAPGIVPGHRYIVAVTGATNDVFSVGAYNFQVTFKGISAVTPPTTPTPVSPPPVAPVPPPPVSPLVTTSRPPPRTTTPPPTSPHQAPPVAKDRFEPDNTIAEAVDLGSLSAKVVTGLTIYAPTDAQVFAFAPKTPGTVDVATGSTSLSVVDSAGRTVATGTGQVSFTAPTAGARYWITVGPAAGKTNPGFALAIAVTPSCDAVAAGRRAGGRRALVDAPADALAVAGCGLELRPGRRRAARAAAPPGPAGQPEVGSTDGVSRSKRVRAVVA